MDIIDRIGPVRAWLAAFVAGLVVFGGGSLVANRAVWDRFVWRYFWGPVEADAHNAACAINDGSTVTYGGRGFTETCSQVAESAIVAEPGYTVVSEIGYMIVGLYFLVGLYLLLDRLNLGRRRSLFFSLVPFMLFGGVLRVVEDANDFMFARNGEFVVSYPLNTLLISPVIYFTVAGVSFASLIACVSVSRRGLVESYNRTLAGIGVGLLVISSAALVILATTSDAVGMYPLFLLTTLVLASGSAYALYALTERFAPAVNAGTGYVGLVVLWAHAVDGVANVLLSDWGSVFDLPVDYQPKHPANEFIISVTQSVQPAALSEAIGTSWPFLAVKLAVAWAIVWLFTEEFVEESPRYSLILLIAIAAVGLGPGTRDMVRATFGI